MVHATTSVDRKGLFIHQGLVLQAGLTPQATALVELSGGYDNISEARQISYRDLDCRTNQLGHWLKAQGVGSNDVVGLIMPRSIDLAIAMYGIMKAGGACLILDAYDPVERQLSCIHQAQPKVLITAELDEPMLESVNQYSFAAIAKAAAEESIDPPLVTQHESDLIYVCFTSGTTGQPKGILIPHAGRDVEWVTTVSDTPVVPSEVGISKAPITTTLFYHEFHASLLTGGFVVLVPREKEKDVPFLFAVLELYSVPVVNLTPSLLRALMEWRDFKHLAHLRAVITYGEGLPGEIEALFYKQSPAELVMYYGCTEATSAVCDRRRCPPERVGIIGTPSFFRSVYILDEELKPVQQGGVGQIVIGRPSAVGYLNDPEGTRMRFVKDPFSSERNAVMFLTGDRARWMDDGTIQMLGREDSLIKLRGHRVELGEVELALKERPELSAAVVKCIEDLSGDLVLVAYLISASAPPPSRNSLRQRLAQKLPEHMIPSAFIFMERFPLTSVGKVNKEALPLPEFMQRGKGSAAVHAASEQKMLSAWRTCLRVRRVSLTDHFLDLGGSSLKAIRLLSQIQHQFGVALPVSIFTTNPTPIGLLKMLDESADLAPSFESLVPVKPSGSNMPFFCVHAAHGDILGFNRLASHFGEAQPFYGIQARGLDGGAPWPESIEEMAAHYISEIKRVAPQGPYALGGRCYGSLVALEMAQALLREGQEVPVLIVLDTLNAFGATRSGFWRHQAQLSLRDIAMWAHRVIGHNAQRWVTRLRARTNEYYRKLETLRQHHLAIRRKYTAKSYLGKIIYLDCQQERRHPEELKAWQQIAQQGVEVVSIPGGHNTMLKEPHVIEVARIVQAKISGGRRSRDAPSSGRTI